MHKWLQLPATPTDDPLATVYPINHFKKSRVYAVTRINPIYVDDEVQPHTEGTWNNNKSGSSGYESQPQSDHSSLGKNSPPAAKTCLRNGTTTPTPSDGSSGSTHGKGTTSSWLSPIKEGVIDVHQYCIPRPVWPGHRNAVAGNAERAHRANCCKHCARCRCRSDSTSSSCSSSSSADSGRRSAGRGDGSDDVAIDGGGGGCYTAYSSSAYGGSASGTISASTTSTSAGRGGTGSCSDDATVPSSGTGSVKSSDLHQSSPLALDPRFGDVGVNKTLMNSWNSIDLRVNQKTDNLQYDCGAMLRGLQFTLDAQQAEKLMQKIKVGKKHRCWCRFVTACLGLIMFLLSVVTVSLALTRGQKMFGSL